MSAPESVVRPTKRQRELLRYIEDFITEHGYSPSYREIMRGLHYNSVATVALHVGNLIRRGHILKRDRSARSLEVVSLSSASRVTSNAVAPAEERWLVEKVEHLVAQAETAAVAETSDLEDIAILLGALRVLGLDGAAQSFLPRVQALKQRQPEAAA